MDLLEKDLLQFESTISLQRLKAYVFSDNDDLETIIQRYKNNILVSQALYPELSILEVTLRNAINTMLCTCISSTWIEDEINQQRILSDYDYRLLCEAYAEVKKNSTQERFTLGKIIANLNFGFWTNLCTKWYNDKVWTKKGCFQGVFVNYPKEKQQKIHQISVKLRSIRQLRNRIFHYEPILKNPQALLLKYNEIMEIMDYLPHDNAKILKDTTSFLKVFTIIMKMSQQKT